MVFPACQLQEKCLEQKTFIDLTKVFDTSRSDTSSNRKLCQNLVAQRSSSVLYVNFMMACLPGFWIVDNGVVPSRLPME